MSEKPKYTKETSSPNLEGKKKKASSISQKINDWLSKMTFLEYPTMPVIASQITQQEGPGTEGKPRYSNSLPC